MSARLEALTQHLNDVAASMGALTPDGYIFHRVTLEGLDKHLANNTDLVERLTALAMMAAASVQVKTPAKPSRIEKQIYTLMTGLQSRDIRALLDAHFGQDKAGMMLDEIEDALGYSRTAFRTTVEYQPPALTATELAQLVAQELKDFGFEVNKSKDKYLVSTLKCIAAATGFKTNAEHAPREVCK